jgi:hypothetical protein
MADDTKIAAVREYIKNEFPDSTIEDSLSAELQGQYFKISSQGRSYNTIVSFDFLNHHEASQIPVILKKYVLAEHLRDLGSTTVIVAKTGLKLEYD